jgi:hypothetical protein
MSPSDLAANAKTVSRIGDFTFAVGSIYRDVSDIRGAQSVLKPVAESDVSPKLGDCVIQASVFHVNWALQALADRRTRLSTIYSAERVLIIDTRPGRVEAGGGASRRIPKRDLHLLFLHSFRTL